MGIYMKLVLLVMQGTTARRSMAVIATQRLATRFVHTLNASGLATVFFQQLEQFQQQMVRSLFLRLRLMMGGLEVLKPIKK